MILSVSLDPKLTKGIMLGDLVKGKDHLAKKLVLIPEDGGMDLSRVVGEFNEESLSLGFLGGRNGEMILDYFTRNLMEHSFIKIERETRASTSIITEDGQKTRIEEESPRVSGSEIEDFYNLYREALGKTDLVCLAGGVARGLQKNIFRDLILLAREEDRKVMAAISGDYLKEALESEAYMLNINLDDLEAITGLLIESEGDIIKLGHRLVEGSTKIVCIYRGGGNYISVLEDRAYISSLDDSYILTEEGCRESFLAGFAVAEERHYDLDYQLRVSIACHIAKGLEYEVGLFNIKRMKSVMNKLTIETFDL